MKTGFDFEEILFQNLNTSSLKTAIDGAVCKKRPIDSKLEDVVIRALTANNLDIQNVIVNVNIYVPNKALSLNGKQDDTQPDTKRLKQLVDIALPLLVDKWQGDLNYNVQNVIMIEDEASKSHYMNIRVEFFSINILN